MGTGADPAGPVDCRVSRQTVVSYGAGTNSTAMVCEMVRRGVELWTNPGDVVLSPFAGIGSEGHVAIKSGRRFVGVELKQSYYRQAVENLRTALVSSFDLFAESAGTSS